MSAGEPSAALPPRIEVASAGTRIALVDLARGLAIVAMVVFHFTWDLALFGLIGVDPEADPFWVWFARLTAGSFLGLVGVSLVLASRKGFRREAFLRRFAVIVAAALAVSAATFAAERMGLLGGVGFVYFGILHAIALVSLAAVPFLRAPLIVVALAAAAAFAAPMFLTSPAFNAWPLVWVGLSTALRPAVDYVPFLPWFGCALVGVLGARLALRWRDDSFWTRWQPRDFVGRALVTAGRWSLVIYLVHQPILFALTAAVAAIVPRQSLEQKLAEEIAICTSSCATSGVSAALCEAQCTCVYGELGRMGLLERGFEMQMTPEQNVIFEGVLRQCRPVPPLPETSPFAGGQPIPLAPAPEAPPPTPVAPEAAPAPPVAPGP